MSIKQNKNISRSFRRLLLNWHHRVGLTAALFVVLLVVTGITLNHTDTLQLSSKKVSWQWLNKWYGTSLADEGMVFSRWHKQKVAHANNRLWFLSEDNALVSEVSCQLPFTGIVEQQSLFIAACNQQLLVISHYEVQEYIGASWGVPQPIDALGVDQQEQLWLKSQGQLWQIDLKNMQWQLTSASPDNLEWSVINPLDKQMQQALRYQLSTLTWEKVFLDVHSGRILGDWGVWLIDMMALLFLTLASSGFWIWFSRRR